MQWKDTNKCEVAKGSKCQFLIASGSGILLLGLCEVVGLCEALYVR